MDAAASPAVLLYWIPLGAGGHSVRLNGLAYEAVLSALERRSRRDLLHSALEITLPDGDRYTVEMTPVPDGSGDRRGVVAEGSVGFGRAGRLRVFRYEIRRWRDGVVPDLDYSVESPVIVTRDARRTEDVFRLLPLVPTLTWGRDESGAGEMWSCNSISSWALTRAGIDTSAIHMPRNARAPGWHAGVAVARRQLDAPARAAVAE